MFQASLTLLSLNRYFSLTKTFGLSSVVLPSAELKIEERKRLKTTNVMEILKRDSFIRRI